MDNRLGEIIKERVLVLDGAMGTMIGAVIGKVGNSDELNLTRPEVVSEIHRKYLDAGADIITTNTFSSQRISQADYHLEDKAWEMACRGAQLARAEADKFATNDKPRFVAGSIGPTNKTLSMSPDVSNPALRDITYDELLEAYMEQVDGLIEGGVDTLLIETIFDTLNAKCAIDAAMRVMDKRSVELPIMLSTAPYYISCYPNAGLPNALGLYDETAESMAPKVGELVDEGIVNIIGGCCGTTDEFIRLYQPLVVGKKPHVPAPKPQTMWLSGLELQNVTDEVHFVNVGERCNVAGSRKFLRLIKEKKYGEALSIARKQVSDGALVIDINMDDGLLDAKQEMITFLNMIAAEPDIAKVPVMIDSSNWEVIKAGLKCVQGKSIVNSISLKEGEEKFIEHALDVKRYGAAVVVMCFDEEGQATTYERRIEIARRAYKILTEKVGMNPLDIIFDPNILAIATGMEEHDAYAIDFIRATAWIKENLPGAHISGGVSNLSFSFRGNNYIREAMHAVFLYHAIKAGMDFGIVNPSTKVTYADIPEDQLEVIEDVVLNRRAGASEQLIELAGKILEEELAKKEQGGADEKLPFQDRLQTPVEERLAQALIKGDGTFLDDDLKESLTKFEHAVEIIEGPLMAGMNKVGKLFGEGKMFLPQVVKTARTMKQAVDILQPYIEAEKTESTTSAGKVLLATVKGDVHDIGKNIVSVVMACNGYDVIDMGVMVPADQIVKKAQEEQVDMIGLSGLITPSLEEMVNVAEELKKAGMDLPIMIGGATTSELHVALKIAPVYGGPVVWMKDASQNALMAAKLMTDKEQVEHELDEKYDTLREEYKQEQAQIVSLEEARKKKPKYEE